MTVRTATTVINIRRTPTRNSVYIGRGSVFGNPFTHLPLERTQAEFQVSSREESVECYRRWLNNDGRVFVRFDALHEDHWRNRRNAILRRVSFLRGCVLGCYCKPLSCHGDVLAEMAEKGNV